MANKNHKIHASNPETEQKMREAIIDFEKRDPHYETDCSDLDNAMVRFFAVFAVVVFLAGVFAHVFLKYSLHKP